MAFPSQTRLDNLSQRATARARVWALAGIVGPIAFTVLAVLQGFLLPDYSHVEIANQRLWERGRQAGFKTSISTSPVHSEWRLRWPCIAACNQCTRESRNPRCWSVESASCWPVSSRGRWSTASPPKPSSRDLRDYSLRRCRAGPIVLSRRMTRRPSMADLATYTIIIESR